MLHFQGALIWARALRKLFLLLSRYVVSTALRLVAWLAEVSVTPAEPLGDTATELALEVDKFLSVLLALLDSSTDGLCCTLTADQLFLLEVGVVLVCLIAVLHSSEIWTLALEAHVVGEFAHCELL